MTKNPKILSIVLAGGEGTRLMPLTRDRAKPAVPFGGVYRLIDFPLSNLVNSGYRQVVVLTQYKSHSLDRHISQVWRFSPLLGSYVSPVPAQQRLGKHWYLGSADAIYQTINIIEDVQPDIVVIVGADHVSRNEAGVYDFNSNEIPGSTATDHAYWRDVGTIKQFYDAHMDLIAYVPEFNLYNQDWPIYTMSGNLPPAKFVHAGRDRLGHATDSIVSPGVIVSGGEVHHSVLSPNVRIHSWAQIVDSVLFDGVVINRRARVYKAILDKNVVLTENSTVGIDTEHDLARGFTVTPDGITVVPKNTIVDD